MVDEQRLTFGFEGIWQGTAVLYDKETKSLWFHLSGKCFDGPLKGKTLQRISSGRHTTWKEWTRMYPDTGVIALDRQYVGRSGDEGYFGRKESRSGSGYLPTSFGGTIQRRDDRLIRNELLYGLVVKGAARAYPFSVLRKRHVVEEMFEDVPVTVWFKKNGRTAAAFDSRVKGVPHSFEITTFGHAKDKQTGSVWTFEGRCVAGSHKGQALRALRGLMAEWYGWYAHYPETSIFGQ